MNLGNARNLIFLPHIPNKEENIENISQCHVCLDKTKLSREHIPPRKAFNNFNKLWEKMVEDAPKLKTRSVAIKGGFWAETVCKKCNNEIGSQYAKEYVTFVQQLILKPTIYESKGDAVLISVNADAFMIAKEIAMMILAFESIDFAKQNYELRKFVMEKNYVLKPDYKILSFLVPDLPQAGTLTRFHARADVFAPGFGFTGGEISFYPIGFIYAEKIGKGYEVEKMTDISHWFSEGDPSSRRNTIIKLYKRISGAESMHVIFSGKRFKPQISYA